MEGTATAGEILLSPECAARLPTQILGKPKGAGILLRSAPRGLSAPAMTELVPEASDVDLAQRGCPSSSGSTSSGRAAEPEHRQVTVAFIHYDGFDALVAKGEGTPRRRRSTNW